MTFSLFSHFQKHTFKTWTPILLYVSLATTLGTAVPVGYMLGVMNTPAEFIKSWFIAQFVERFNINLNDYQADLLSSFIVSTFLIGGIFGSVFGACFSDRFGRKGCLSISAILLLLSGILFNFCRVVNSVEMLLIGRFLGGIAAALIYTAHPMYLLEIAPAELRGTLAVFTAVGVTGGICLGQVVSLNQIWGTDEMWHYALSFHVWLVVLGFIGNPWYPESPNWLFSVRKNTEAARIELLRLRGTKPIEVVNAEILEMELATKLAEHKLTLGAMLRNSEYLLPLFIVCSFQICQQLSGINAIFFYSVPIFTKAGFSAENASWMNLGAGVLNLLMSLLGPWLMARFNRRPLMLLSCLCCFGAHLGLAFALNYIDYADWLPVACIAFMTAFISLFQFGLGPIPYFIGTELFEISPRPVAMSMGSLFSWCGNFIIGMFFPMLQSVWGSFVFLPCAAVCLYGAAVTWRYLPETRGRDPADLRPIMKNGFRTKIK